MFKKVKLEVKSGFPCNKKLPLLSCKKKKPFRAKTKESKLHFKTLFNKRFIEFYNKKHFYARIE